MPTPAEMAASMKANLKENTGKTLAQWLKITKASGLAKHGLIVKHLKSEHGMTHGYASLVAHETLQSAAEHQGEDDLVANQYSGKKADLKPIYDALVDAAKKFGAVEFAPKKAYVSLRAKKQFGLIQPSTATRVDLGLCSSELETGDRLEASGSFNSMCTHRVRLSSVQDVDAEVVGWMKTAFREKS